MSLPFDAIPGHHAEAYCSACERWSPLERWNDYDEFDDDDRWVDSAAVCPLCGHHHPPYDPPIREIEEGADVNDKTADRWSGFSDEELLELRAGCEGRAEVRALPEDIRRRAERLSVEVWHELRRRRGRYRGPGVYVATKNGAEQKVYGLLDPLGRSERLLVVRPDPESDLLTTVPMRLFERALADDQPAYEWVRPLPGQEER